MSTLVADSGYTGSAYQNVVWHYRTDISKDVLNKWFVNIFNVGVLAYTPNAADIGGTDVTISAGTSFIIKSTGSSGVNDKITKCDVLTDRDPISVAGYADGAYKIYATWEDASDDTRGVEFSIPDPDVAPHANSIVLGTITIASSVISATDTTGQTVPGVSPALTGASGYSGYSGEAFVGSSGYSGYSGNSTSGFSGYSGESGTGAGAKGDSGYSGYTGISGYSGYSGYTGVSGKSGYSGSMGPSYSTFKKLRMATSATQTITANSTATIQLTINAGFGGGADPSFTFDNTTYSLTCANGYSGIYGVHGRIVSSNGDATSRLIPLIKKNSSYIAVGSANPLRNDTFGKYTITEVFWLGELNAGDVLYLAAENRIGINDVVYQKDSLYTDTYTELTLWRYK